MNNEWSLPDAKEKFNELVNVCQFAGPQFIIREGVARAVILSKEGFDKLKDGKLSFIEFIKQSPLKGVEFDIKRSRVHV